MTRVTASGLFWNLVVPALGLALILGAPMLLAFAAAAAASLLIAASPDRA
jgi:hypothetical protein